MFIDGVFVSAEILTARFQCDIAKCKGACCYADDPTCEGAPLTQEEATLIRKRREFIAKHIWSSPKRRSMAITRPVYAYKGRKPFRVRLDGSRCIFCDNDGCVLSAAHRTHPEVPAQPISCALYPISEEWDYNERKPYLYLEHYFDERFCKDGYTLGEKNGTYLIDFCKDALIRRFGEDFYKHLKEAQHELIG